MKNGLRIVILSVITSLATLVFVSIFGLPRINPVGEGVVTKNLKQQYIEQNITRLSNTTNLESDVTNAIEKATPSLVTIQPTRQLAGSGNELTLGGGNGVIIAKDGYILTNKHVLGNTSENTYSILTNDGDTYYASGIWTDPLLDVAIIKIVTSSGTVPSDIQPANFIGMNSPLRLGMFVIGFRSSPLITNNEASLGIITATNQSFTHTNGLLYDGLIQTNIQGFVGDSGSPLLGTDGSVIGLVTATDSNGSNKTYALPISREFIESTLKSITTSTGTATGGVIQRPTFGVDSTALTKKTAKELSLIKYEGFHINSILTGSVAASGGLLSGDVITDINGRTMNTTIPLLYTIYGFTPGEQISVTVFRDREYKKLSITLGGK